jgi:hypothetical protein
VAVVAVVAGAVTAAVGGAHSHGSSGGMRVQTNGGGSGGMRVQTNDGSGGMCVQTNDGYCAAIARSPPTLLIIPY